MIIPSIYYIQYKSHKKWTFRKEKCNIFCVYTFKIQIFTFRQI